MADFIWRDAPASEQRPSEVLLKRRQRWYASAALLFGVVALGAMWIWVTNPDIKRTTDNEWFVGMICFWAMSVLTLQALYRWVVPFCVRLDGHGVSSLGRRHRFMPWSAIHSIYCDREIGSNVEILRLHSRAGEKWALRGPYLDAATGEPVDRGDIMTLLQNLDTTKPESSTNS